MKKKSLRLVEVRWHDAWQRSGWSDEDNEPDDNDPEICFAYGLVVKDTKKGLTLGGATSPTKDKIGWGHKQFIPRGMIVEIREIEKLQVNLEK